VTTFHSYEIAFKYTYVCTNPACFVRYEVWCVVCGVWCVVCGVWCVVCGVWCGVCGVWCVVCGVVWCVWCVVCGVWCVVCGVWCVVCGVWCDAGNLCRFGRHSRSIDLDRMRCAQCHCKLRIEE
jgi:hypothetical protein